MSLYRCSECTLLRVEREGMTCVECLDNMGNQATTYNLNTVGYYYVNVQLNGQHTMTDAQGNEIPIGSISGIEEFVAPWINKDCRCFEKIQIELTAVPTSGEEDDVFDYNNMFDYDNLYAWIEKEALPRLCESYHVVLKSLSFGFEGWVNFRVEPIVCIPKTKAGMIEMDDLMEDMKDDLSIMMTEWLHAGLPMPEGFKNGWKFS